MKKLLLLITLFLAALSQPVNAQEFDELDLVGRWTQKSKTGEFTSYKKYEESPDISMQTPEVLLFYEEPNIQVNDDSLGVAYYCDPNYPLKEYNENTWQWEPTGEYGEYWEYVGIRDYFISNNNKLHILMRGAHYALRFRIVSLDASNMTLETLNGKGIIVFEKDQPASVRPKIAEAPSNDRYYTLDGKLLNEPPRYGVFIKNKKKYAK